MIVHTGGFYVMKKTLSLFFVLLILTLPLAACADVQTGNALYQELPTVPQTNRSLKVFIVANTPEPLMIQAALNRYQQLYPDVEVELIQPLAEFQNYVDPQLELYYEPLLTQLMAGEGPDILLVDGRYMDIEKLVRQGIFADMEPFFQADNFDWEPYNQGVMDAGVWNGKRFLFPLSYDFPLLCTTKEALEETNFNMDACKDFQGFLDETARYMEDASQSRRLFSGADVPRVMGISSVFDRSGISVVNYDAKTADLSLPLFQSVVQWYKAVADTHPQTPNYSLVGGAAVVRDGQALWTTSVFGADYDLFGTAGALRTVGEVVTMPIRDTNGGIQVLIESPVAVRANSENLQNAYNFLKILLSQEIQETNTGAFNILHAENERYLKRRIGIVYEEGTDGFVSTNHPGSAVNEPSQEEIQQLLELTKEITGGYYYKYNDITPMMLMYPYLYQGADFEETLEAARSRMELYLSE